jgi:hypothetical protein
MGQEAVDILNSCAGAAVCGRATACISRTLGAVHASQQSDMVHRTDVRIISFEMQGVKEYAAVKIFAAG